MLVGTHVRVTPGTADDLEAISEIYDHFVRTTAATFDVERRTADAWREWFSAFDERGRRRLVVARDAGGVIGYASSSPYRSRAAYAPSVETSVYVDPRRLGRGVGTALYEALFSALANEDVHRAYAGIAMPNPASVRLHERCGFRRAGYFTQQGRKFGRYWDVAWYERSLSGRASGGHAVRG
jgi:phosphinothricin acetyltransferase